MKYLLLILLLFLASCSEESAQVSPDANVSAQANITVLSEPVATRGDLVPKMYPKTIYPVPGQDVEIKLAVQNRGVERITKPFSYKAVLSKDGTVLYEKSGDYQTGTLLPTDEAILHTFTYKFASAGSYDLNMQVDTKEMLNELDETNNNKTLVFFAKEKDPDETAGESTDEDASSSQPSGLEGDEAKTIVEEYGCYDSDSGKDLEKAGMCYDSNSFKNGKSDFCVTGEKIAEMYCENRQCRIAVEECGNKFCKDNECI